ncbi:MAG TPA: vWA domain-containing protein [Polyangium sp.]|nr:vWA domain-containing protein [Polyangium sp.]
MRRHNLLFLGLGSVWIASAWVGCAEPLNPNLTSSSSSSSSSSSTSGSGGSGGDGGGIAMTDGGTPDDGACVTTSAEARRVPLDILFLIDRSASMSGPKWEGTKTALNTFFNDPASAGIGAGMVYFPAQKADVCNPQSYSILDVPIALLPANTFALTNSIPFSPLGTNTPTYPALEGALKAATAYQDANPTHKVVVVLATDGDPTSCPPTTIDEIAFLAKTAINYNGVRTFVIGAQGSTIANLDKIAASGGTTKAYDITQDITAFAAKMEEIRSEALACDFEIPEPPNGEKIDFNRVNFTYTPKGLGTPKLIPRAMDLADCGNDAAWYYDSNLGPTKIILCPASCTTVQADEAAKVSVLFGCDSILK